MPPLSLMEVVPGVMLPIVYPPMVSPTLTRTAEGVKIALSLLYSPSSKTKVQASFRPIPPMLFRVRPPMTELARATIDEGVQRPS